MNDPTEKLKLPENFILYHIENFHFDNDKNFNAKFCISEIFDLELAEVSGSKFLSRKAVLKLIFFNYSK